MSIDVNSLKYRKFYLATTNRSKIERMTKIFRWISEEIGEEIKLEAVPELIDVDETEPTLEENSLKKALAYKGKYQLPIISLDSGMFIDNEEIDSVKIKRNALEGTDESKLTEDEIYQKMLKYYQKIAEKHGGKADFYFKDVYTILFPDGSRKQTSSVRHCTLTAIPKGYVPQFPIRSLYISKATGKRPAEQTEEDEKKEFRPICDAIVKLISEE